MKQISISDLFSSEELKTLGRYEESFSALLVQLERFALIAERFPVSFKINDTLYSFPDKQSLDTAIESLKNEYDKYVLKSGVNV